MYSIHVYINEKGGEIGIGQIEQSVGMKLHLVWQYLMRWKWAGRKIPNVEGEQFKYFTTLQEMFIEYILSIFVRGIGKKVYFCKTVLHSILYIQR